VIELVEAIHSFDESKRCSIGSQIWIALFAPLRDRHAARVLRTNAAFADFWIGSTKERIRVVKGIER